MTLYKSCITFQPDDGPAAFVDALVRQELGGSAPSFWLTDYDQSLRTGTDWMADLARSQRGVTAKWGAPPEDEWNFTHRLHIDSKTDVVTWDEVHEPPTLRHALHLLRTLPLLMASASSLFGEWSRPGPLRYKRVPSLGLGWHGWMCAFRGAGHDQLVSRRWLEHGPWRLIRDPDCDLSLVQFHDLTADAATALAQAKPGHARMGAHEHGGFMSEYWRMEHDLHGLYHPEEQLHEIVVHGREVSPREMLELAIFRHRNRTDAERPIERIAFVFMEPRAAEAHLHELWLRDIECWAIVEGRKTRLDLGYEAAPPPKPDWVRKVEAETDGPNAAG